MKMRKIGILSILIGGVLLMMLAVPVLGAQTTISWSEPIKIYDSLTGAYYPRPLLCQNGTIMLAFDEMDTSTGVTRIRVLKSNDKGNSWSEPVDVAGEPGVTYATPQLLELENGDILCAYRTSVEKGEDWQTGIYVSVSHDGGTTWEPWEQGYTVDQAVTQGRYGGIWEPHLGFAEGELVIMYCDDSDRIGTSGGYQNLLLKKWTGSGWSEAVSVSAPETSRDGMPVWTQLQDRRYLVVFETTDVQPANFGLKYKISENGTDWSGERLLLDNPAPGRVHNAPYVSVLSDGRLLCTFQTDEFNQVHMGTNASHAYAMEGWVQEDGSILWGEKYPVFPVSDRNWSTMVSTLPVDANTVLAFCCSDADGQGLYMRVGTYSGSEDGWNLLQTQLKDNRLTAAGVSPASPYVRLMGQVLFGATICLLILTSVLGVVCVRYVRKKKEV